MIFKDLGTPFLLVRAGSPDSTTGFNDIVFTHAGCNFNQIWIKDTTHTSFTDLPYFADELGIPNTGSLDPRRNFQVIRKVILTFFAQHVLRDNHAISKIADQYPEIILAGPE